MAFRIDNALVLRADPVFAFGPLVFMFLLGVRLFRAGAFGSDATGRRVRGRLLVWGLGVGVPVNLATSLAGQELIMLDRYVVALDYVGLVGWVLDRVSATGPVVRGLSFLGRLAMTG